MELEQYIQAIEAGPAQTGPAGEDRPQDASYLREASFRFRAILAAMPESTAPLRIVDIGATLFSVFLRQRYPQHEFWCVDRDDVFRPRLIAAGFQHRICDLNCEKLPLADESFDLVIFTQILEHLYTPPSRVLTDIRRVLKPGGRLILSVPNFAALHKRLKLLLGRQILPDPDQAFSGDGSGHLHEYTLAEITRLLRRNGFRIERRACLTWSIADTLACRHRPLSDRLVRSVYHAVQWVWPTFRTTLLLVASRV